ncbi:SRPBCC family protein [Serinicoccus kebangsaanensis]|uniref:SRPBCC family protein n=1 Tax=Serinicoccus kebangsaanensis TaxID=2602069 RepID=UPI00124DFA22|nr:SRPBCC family protein [Serinicoccus kebangsaanensis]
MASFWFDVLVPGAPALVWERLWDLDRHTAAIPLTRTLGGPLGPDAEFVARTGVGPLRVDDRMRVRGWDPPHRAVVEKVGRPLTGRIEVLLRAAGADTRVRWEQEYAVTGVPDAVAALAAPVVRSAYLRAVRQITAP